MKSPLPRIEKALNEIRRKPDDSRQHQTAITLLESIPLPNKHCPAIYELLSELYEAELGPIQRACLHVARQLWWKHDLHENDFAKATEALAGDDLFFRLMARTLNMDLRLEQFLIQLRRSLLNENNWSVAHFRVACAIAHQAWATDFIWPEDESETTWLESNWDSDWHYDSHSIARMAMFRPLHDLPDSARLLNCEFEEPLECLVELQIANPLKESEFAKTIPSLGEVQNFVSRKVKEQYEEYPYPKWVTFTPPFPSIGERIRNCTPDYTWPDSIEEAPQSVLVAGGGTGQHPLRIAKGDPAAQFVSLDLSLASLSYAKRITTELGIENVEFVRGDLLESRKLGRMFDHVETVGTLHHMESPEAGWRVLTEVLKPGGTIHVGVYGAMARLPVKVCRNEITQLGLRPTSADMKKFRQQIIEDLEEKPTYRRLLGYPFFSLCSLRDMLFHESEYQYQLPEIKELMDTLGLELLGFDGPLPAAVGGWEKVDFGRAIWEDPTALREFEMKWAGSMLMFRFFAQKRGCEGLARRTAPMNSAP